MIALLTAPRALLKLAANMKERRLAQGLTQAGLSARSGVALGTLRKFERTGEASTQALVKLLAVVGGLEAVLAASAPEKAAFASIDEVLDPGPTSKRKHGWRT